MRRQSAVIFYFAAVLVLSLGYFTSPLSNQDASFFPGLAIEAHANPLTTVLVFLIISAALAFLAFPSMPIVYMAAGFYMVGLVGSAIVLVGSAFGGFSAFLFYRKHIPHSIDSHPTRHSELRIWLTLLGLRLSPLVPAPLVNFFAAVFYVSPFQYLTTSVLGSAPLILFYVQIGQQGHQFLSGGSPQWYEFSGYAIILTISTLLSAFGPGRAMLSKLWHLKCSFSLQSADEPVAPGRQAKLTGGHYRTHLGVFSVFSILF